MFLDCNQAMLIFKRFNMFKHPGYWLSLCLSSLAVAVSLTTIPVMTGTIAQNQMVAQAKPCAGKPCAGKPCAGKPCAGKPKPCAGKPCAGKPSANSVGGPLAQQLQGKPVVVDVYASWCTACKNVAPTLSRLKQDYAGKVNFVVLDVSNPSTTSAAKAKAKELGLDKFLNANKSQTGLIAIVDPATGNILAQHRNNSSAAAYTAVLDKALAR
jgi:thiol-disulfide isomerase/thioredoxin